ncbi:MAG: hypothetical protein AAGI66_03785 [Cyanobacteria bacterium P01_H01_bin.74]
MFKCQSCQSTEFRLVVNPNQKKSFSIKHNAFNEVVICINQEEFIADLAFMNHFAVCKSCDDIKCWDYFFRQEAIAM